ncbi:MAG: type II toxin-antitoxin system RelE/ParE family toxin [Desulfovibrionales bacterium]|nr:type II toxin-antitoxin system RelE/ParE family toxin [Desulfovibrionales bacterium]
MSDINPVVFIGTSLEDLRAFPGNPRREAGYQIDKLQRGDIPDSWKPVTVIGPGVQEIRLRDASGQFRVLYVAKFAEAVYILHCFCKKTQRIPRKDLELAANRYQELLKGRQS